MTSPSVGTMLPSQTFEVTRAQLVRYAGAALDFNPIHWSDDAAAAAGLPDVIAHGMLSMALAGRVITHWTGDVTAIVDFRVRFSAPVPVPATGSARVEGSGTVTAVREDGCAEIEVQLRSGDRDVLTKAIAVVRP
jgi:acyl dehydratase